MQRARSIRPSRPTPWTKIRLVAVVREISKMRTSMAGLELEGTNMDLIEDLGGHLGFAAHCLSLWRHSHVRLRIHLSARGQYQGVYVTINFLKKPPVSNRMYFVFQIKIFIYIF
ncbi:hypothetical protein J5N97_029932 [Dioscorea zingiberensis]|uniref:Uncharacterized protein n=1 Tax=Dioscorea zingiberensis TaxID=325984 RepID=A0A9D5H3R9_9LILI|nr:hypothetical protein J5N97_029932 [Dioscorea zingiberensis]